MLRVSLLEECLVVDLSQQVSVPGQRIIDVHDERFSRNAAEGFPDDRTELAVGEEDLGFAVVEDESNGLGVQPDVESVQHRPRHGDSVMRLEHFGDVRRHDAHGIAPAHSAARERAREPARAPVELPVGVGAIAVDDGGVVGVHRGRAREEGKGRQGLEVRRVLLETDVVDGRHRFARDAITARAAGGRYENSYRLPKI